VAKSGERESSSVKRRFMVLLEDCVWKSVPYILDIVDRKEETNG